MTDNDNVRGHLSSENQLAEAEQKDTSDSIPR